MMSQNFTRHQLNMILMFLLLSFVLAITDASAQKVYKIGDNTMTIAPSAVLELESINKGFLPARMTFVQRDLIAATVGLMVYCTDCGANGELEYYNGISWVNMVGGNTGDVPVTVTSSTGQIWIDRNLGASQVATSSTDAASYGYLFQWGRGADGHQIRTSATTATLSSGDTPGHGLFITSSAGDYDWRSSQNDDLWQGVSAINNPCFKGYRLPTQAEFTSEISVWSTQNAAGAYASVLKLTVGGSRSITTGSLSGEDGSGTYWTSTFSGIDSRYLLFSSSIAYVDLESRANGYAVRCIKN